MFLDGIVPWIISEEDSHRQHGDIELICKKEDMGLIRSKLVEYGVYDKKLDSLLYQQDGQIQDYGVDTYIVDVPVGFYPYDINNGKIVQRTFSPKIINGKSDLKVKIIDGIDENDYLTQSTLKDGTIIGHSTLEMIRAMKVKAGRQKDYYDILKIDEIGIDIARQARVNRAVENMISTLDEQKNMKVAKKRNVNDDFGEI